jgi:DNA-binding transcriptional regulator LsrR (DeoR family)
MISIEEIRSNSHRPPAVVARAAVCYVAIRDLGFTPTAVAAQLGISRRSVARAFERAQQIGLASDAALTTFTS